MQNLFNSSEIHVALYCWINATYPFLVGTKQKNKQQQQKKLRKKYTPLQAVVNVLKKGIS